MWVFAFQLRDDCEEVQAILRDSDARMEVAGAVNGGRRDEVAVYREEKLQMVAPNAPGSSLRLDSLADVIDAFLLSRRAGNCSTATLRLYAANLVRFRRTVGIISLAEADIGMLQRYLADLQDSMKVISVHQHFRTLKTFFAWCVETGLVTETPMRTFRMRVPKTFPHVPDAGAVRALLRICPNTFEGWRNKALVALLADSGLRISEALRLRIEDVDFADRVLRVKAGKGAKDGVGFFGTETAQLLRAWLARRHGAAREDFLLVDSRGRPLSRCHACHVLHRLSVRAGLPSKVGPHALRHFAASSILKQTGDLYLVRDVLRHETLAMTLRYARLNQIDVSRKFRKASPLDSLRTMA